MVRLKVGVFDDHQLYRQGIVATLGSQNGFEVVAVEQTREAALRALRTLDLDLILLDPGIASDGARFIREVREVSPATRVLIISNDSDADVVAHTVELGSGGYLLKTVTCQEFIEACGTVAGGEFYLMRSLVPALVGRVRDGAQAGRVLLSTLTVREREVLAHLTKGKSNKEIAIALAISEKTVKHYMTSIMSKLNVRNRVEAVLAAG